MRVFISYRRSDTGGRAGRLRDALAARFGERNVFHDVTALAPGVEFDERIGETIAACDVVLVLIGSRWLDEADPAGGRRLDRLDDYVRHEVRDALVRHKRIVPVLVEEARLPSASELPEDIAPLVRRQAFVLRDVSWQQDVRELVRGLELDPTGEPHRSWASHVLLAVLAVGGAVGAVTIGLGAFSGGDDTSDDDLPPCDPADGAWAVAAPGDASPVDLVVAGEPARFEPRGARYLPSGDGSLIVVEVAVTSTAEPGTATDLYLSEGILDALLIDGVEVDLVVCARVIGDAQILPGRTAIGEIGFSGPVDPSGATIELATDGGGIVEFGTG